MIGIIGFSAQVAPPITAMATLGDQEAMPAICQAGYTIIIAAISVVPKSMERKAWCRGTRG